MKVVIPLAGKGTRLRPHTYVTPKPLVPVAGRPVMSYILDDLEELGVEEIIFITGYLKEHIEEYVRSEYPQFRSHFVEQVDQNGTAGAVLLAEPYIDDELLIIFVDTLFDADLSIVRDIPEELAGVIWAKEVEDYQSYGVVVTDKDGNMTRIVEKPQDPISRLANIGLYYIRDWELLFQGIHHVLEGTKGPGEEYYLTDAFQYMIDHGAKIRTIEVDGWYDCGLVDTLIDTNRYLLESGRGLRPVGGVDVKINEPVRIEEGVELEEVEIGPNVTVAAGSVIRRSKLRDTIIGPESVVEDADLHDSLIGAHVEVRGAKGALNIADHSAVIDD